ncbi:MAG: PAS domain S-box protein [Desulfocapsaceae bacterium]|jgi:PAS domain S-box-containing protein|nr:PAS domain S-box protein [Desulfocapsaceae bacterium]
MTDTQPIEQLQSQITELQKKLDEYRVLVNNTPDLLYRTDLEGRITFVSPSVTRLTGYSVEEATGMKMAEDVYFSPDERARLLKRLRSRGRVTNFNARLKKKDGSLWWASTNAHFYYDEDGRILGIEGITRDVSELKNAESALMKSEKLFRVAFHTSPDSINLNRAEDGIFIDINDGFTKLMGYSRREAIGRSSLSLNIWRNPEDRNRLINGLQEKGFVENLEAEFVRKSGVVGTGLMSARFITVNDEQVILSITRDITEKKVLERQLQQAQKFEALGTLAGGIAHDFNNLLMGIQGRASLLAMELGQDHPLSEHADGIEEYVRSATKLTQQLLGIARRGKYEIQPVDISELVTKSATMFARTRKELHVHLNVADDHIIVEADQQQLEQVLLNVLINSWQAMPDGGEIIIDLKTLFPEDTFCSSHQIQPGHYCKISITDTGVGMDEKTKQCAFDPFYTTKEIGRGTGLGLASAMGIIKNHGGTIAIDSEINQGTTINIYLCVSKRKANKTDSDTSSLICGSGCILLIDDEPVVIDVGTSMLEALGYHVITAADGQRALEILEEKNHVVDLIILDLIMPGMSGEQVFNAVQKIEPRVPVLLSSGYSAGGQVSEILAKGCRGFIQKPFNISGLSEKLSVVFDENSRES